MYVYIYIYTYNKLRNISYVDMSRYSIVRYPASGARGDMPRPPTKSSGFSGFGSSKLSILKGGNSYARIIS